MIRLCTVVLVALCLAPWPVLAASRATVDRNPLKEGEIVTLTLETDQDTDPEMKPLTRDFEIRGSAQSRQISLVNGNSSVTTRWSFQLLPRRLGKITIPAITIGNDHTQPIPLTIIKATDSSSLSQERDLLIEASVDKQSAYVREQVTLTVAFYQSVSILEGGLSRPAPADTVVESIGEGRVSEEIRDGIRYRVTRIRYALYPQTSGTLNIDPVVFNGKVVVEDKQNQSQNLGGFRPFAGLIGQSRRVRLRSKPLQVKVLPQPAAADSGHWWLPVTSLKLKETWTPDPPEFKLGEPVTRTISMQAIGTVESMLPALNIPDVAGMKLYPDQPVSETAVGGDTLIAGKEFKIAMIPSRAGEIELPEVSIPWWNLNKKRMETATLPARRITVAGAPPPPVDTAAPAPTVSEPTPEPGIVAATGAAAAGSPWPWLLAAAAMLLWLATLLLWWRDRRRRPTTRGGDGNTRHSLSVKAQVAAVNSACDSNNAEAAARALIALADRIQGPVRNLGAVKVLLASEVQREAVLELEQHLYGRDTDDWSGAGLRLKVVPALQALADGKGAATTDTLDSVPALYQV